MATNKDSELVQVNDGANLNNYFKHLNQHSIARKLMVNERNEAGAPVTTADSIDSLLEFIGKGEILFDEELQESQTTNNRTNRLIGLYNIVLNAKFRLVDVLKSDPRFTESSQLFVEKQLVKKAVKK